MGPYIEAAEDEFNYAEDWLEIITTDASPSNSHLSSDVQEGTLQGYVPWNKQRSCARHFCGFAWADENSPYRLFRENPKQHPIFPQLFAYDVSFTPFLPRSNPDADDSAPKIEGVFDPDLAVAYHRYAVATVRYRNYRCDFEEDSEIAENQYEWKRNTFIDVEPKIEALQVTGGLSQLTFAEATAGQPPANTRFGAPLAQLLSKTSFVVNWLNVPWAYLSNAEYYLYPAKILACVGTVNSDAMFDDGVNSFAAGTLLFQPPKWTIKTAPVASDDPRYPLRYVDLQLPFEYFEPEKGVPASAYKGHNLMPWSGDGTAANPGDGKFYHATRDGTAGGTKLLRATDHRNIFKSIND